MEILITGGAGYKGIVLTQALLNLGHQVTILDNFLYGYDSVLHLVENPSVEIVRANILNLNSEMVQKYDVIFHLAGISGYPACEANPHAAKQVNVDASQRLGELLSKDQWLIYASTTSIYGKCDGICNEDFRVNPISLYAQTKYQAERILLEREKTVALRFATLFGISPRMRIDLLVNDFTYKAVNERCIILYESRSKRTFLHIKDAIAGYILALDHFQEMEGQVFNVGCDSMNYSKLEIAQQIKKFTECKIIDSDIKDFDIRNFTISFEKILDFGFLPKYTLDDGIVEMVRLFHFYNPFLSYRII